nr:hypothetical protein [Lachnospiraceae bacterium]
MIGEVTTLISLDTSTRNTGYSLYKNGTLSSYGLVSAKGSSCEPLDDMLGKLASLLDKCRPDIVVVENTVVLRNARVLRDLTQILGGVRFWCITNGACFYTLNPTEWRRLVKGTDETLPRTRKELKDWSVSKASEYSHKELTSNDVSDAILIGQAYI